MSNFLSVIPGFLKDLWEATFSLCLAGSFLMVWSGSRAFGPKASERFILIIVVDLILLLYSLILAAIAFNNQERAKIKTSLLLATGLLVVTGVISLTEQIWLPFVAAVVLVASRLRLLFLIPRKEKVKRRIVLYPLACLMLLFLLLWATAFLPIPAWGVKPLGNSNAIWSKFPQRALVLGILYYGLLGLFAIGGFFRSVTKAKNMKDTGGYMGDPDEHPITG